MFRAPGTIAPETGTLPARRIWSGRWYRVMASGDFPALLSVIGRHDHQEAAGIVVKDTGSALFGAEGLRVTDVQAGPGSALEVWAVTDYLAAAACPACSMISSRVHETVLARPRDVRRAADPVDLRWVKVRRKCVIFPTWSPT